MHCFHHISTCSLCFLSLASLNIPILNVLPFLRNLQWKSKTHPNTKIIFFKARASTTESSPYTIAGIRWRLGDFFFFLPCWTLFSHHSTGMRNGSSLVAKREFAEMGLSVAPCFSLLTWNPWDNRNTVLCCPLPVHWDQSDLNTEHDGV